MSGSVNKVILVGHLGKDPESRFSQDGAKIISFSIATGESWKDKQTGERRDKTEWSNVVVFNPHLADIAEKYLHKGSKVYVEGKIQTRKWTDKQGQERYSTEVVLPQFGGEITLLDRKEENQNSGYVDPSFAQQSSYQPSSTTTTSSYNSASTATYQSDSVVKFDDLNDDIPF
jgi:single-strand DNA-binding protein